MKVIELIQKLLEMDRNLEVVVSEFYAVDDEQVLRIDHNIVGHMIDENNGQVIFLIPNRDGKIGNENV